MRLRFKLTVGILFILAGGLLGSNYIIDYIRESNVSITAAPQIAALKADNKAAEAQSTAYPTNVTIPSINLSVDVAPGYYDTKTQTWTLNDSDAFFATISIPPNTISGNTYIYGHNRGNVFNPLNKTAIGTIATVKTTDNKTYTYKMSAIHDVSPNDPSWLLNYRGAPILTLQTCAGFFDQYRRLFIFDFVSEA